MSAQDVPTSLSRARDGTPEATDLSSETRERFDDTRAKGIKNGAFRKDHLILRQEACTNSFFSGMVFPHHLHQIPHLLSILDSRSAFGTAVQVHSPRLYPLQGLP